VGVQILLDFPKHINCSDEERPPIRGRLVSAGLLDDPEASRNAA
jgi:hypothetical protein